MVIVGTNYQHNAGSVQQGLSVIYIFGNEYKSYLEGGAKMTNQHTRSIQLLCL